MNDASITPARAPGLLFLSLAEQVKLPFVAIAHAAELLRLSPNLAEHEELSKTIALTSQAALKLIDGYLLSVQLQQSARLGLEPVSLGSVAYDTAERLQSYARAFNCDLEVDIKGKYGPVMARHEVVKSALEALGYCFIEAAAQPGVKPKIMLSVRRTALGISAGVFCNTSTLSGALYKQAKILKGQARQPLGSFNAGSGAGVFVADALFSWLSSPLRVAHYNGMRGLAATLTPSNQLSFLP